MSYATFDAMLLHEKLLRGIYSYGFEHPSAIQQLATVPLAQGIDVVAQAPAGTGKTGAFAIGLLQRLDMRRRGPQALVLSPTRELAEQTHGVVREMGEYLFDGAEACHLFVGGTSVGVNMQALQTRKVMVVVGTPGRVVELVKRGAMPVEWLRTIVLDEADELLSQGFSEQIAELLRFVPRDVQFGLFSMTMPEEVLELGNVLMRKNAARILMPPEELSLKGIRQYYVKVEDEAKLATLFDLYDRVSISQAVIFGGSRRRVEWLGEELQCEGHVVAVMHAEMVKGERGKVMRAFRSGVSRVLVATDVVARGIDVQHVNIVINFDLPHQEETYLHRIGRSGRYGRKGIAINFVSTREVARLRAIEACFKVQIDELPEDFESYFGDT